MAMWSNVYVMMTTPNTHSDAPLRARLVILYVPLPYRAPIVSSTGWRTRTT